MSPIKKSLPSRVVKPFVVYVTFPNSMKEYSYLCDIPGVRQGSTVIANHTEVTVRRTSENDNMATKWVSSRDAFDILKARTNIMAKLEELAKTEEKLARFAKLKSPEAKKLLRELKSLS